MRWIGGALAALAVSVVLMGCGGGRTYGQALDEYCSRWDFNAKVEDRCFNELYRRGQRFLEYVEGREQTAAELEGLRLFHP